MYDNDHTDAEIARREHDLEMGGETPAERAFFRWLGVVEAKLIALGFTDAKTGVDGNECPLNGYPDDGFSIDGAVTAFYAHVTPYAYVAQVASRRRALWLLR